MTKFSKRIYLVFRKGKKTAFQAVSETGLAVLICVIKYNLHGVGLLCKTNPDDGLRGESGSPLQP